MRNLLTLMNNGETKNKTTRKTQKPIHKIQCPTLKFSSAHRVSSDINFIVPPGKSPIINEITTT